MTIAAGFRFADGILICADTEISHGSELKTRGSKIFPYRSKRSDNKLVFTFSGDVAHSKMCIQGMARAVAALPPDRWGVAGVYDALKDELYNFHHQYIFKHPRYPYGDGPQVNLIVGAWCAEEKRLNLYESSEAALVEVSDIEPMAITGTGSTLCRYIARPLIPGQYMALADVLTVAVYSLREAKDNVPGCGKATELITLSSEGELGSLGWLHSADVEKFADSFATGIRHLFVETCDLSSSDQQLKQRFDMLWAIMESTRSYLRSERQKDTGFPALIEQMVKRKTTEF
jgi:20S proteasome alpha/beta subunit